MSDDPQRADRSAMFEVLADERRRLALYYLRDRGSATLDELATVVSGWQRARRSGRKMVTPEDRSLVRTRLHHLHLPKLDDAGVVRYDRHAGDVAYAEPPALLEAILDQALSTERRSAGASSEDDEGGQGDDEERDDERRVGDE